MTTTSCERFMLWIDGVGAWLVCAGWQFQVGGPTLEGVSADICLMADISRHHATFEKIQEEWFIRALHPTVVSGKSVSDRCLLKSGDEIRLGNRLRLGFRTPSVLSGTAVIDFVSHHRPQRSVNGIILMTDSCQLGPRSDQHVCCPDWPGQVVLFQQQGQIRIRSSLELTVNGTRLQNGAELADGSTVCSGDLRFRVERLSGQKA
jgi:hypothetical protein